MEYGCIGEHLAHSFSKEIHNKIENYSYELFEVAKDKLDTFMKEKNFKAINVTIPYKQDVIPYLYYIDDTAKKIGAVNTIVNKQGKLYGYNTDFMGMTALIKKAEIEIKDKKVLVLGTGGTSKTAFAVAKSMGAKEVVTVSRSERSGCITYSEAKLNHFDADVIINTTPCGMYPNNDGMPVNLSDYPKCSGVIDAVYNPFSTKLILEAKKRGIKAEGGLYMLVAQAVFAAQKFTGKTYDEKVIKSIYNEILLSKQNIVLIGMPGSGKTTVGKIIAEKLSRTFVDTDRMIVEKHGEISEIFEVSGETAFRDMETQSVVEASKKWGQVIATGGGAILRDQNTDALCSNGVLFFIDRPLEALVPTDDRPLAKDVEAIKKRYSERYSIYCNAADVIIDANCDANGVAHKILQTLE